MDNLKLVDGCYYWAKYVNPDYNQTPQVVLYDEWEKDDGTLNQTWYICGSECSFKLETFAVLSYQPIQYYPELPVAKFAENS